MLIKLLLEGDPIEFVFNQPVLVVVNKTARSGQRFRHFTKLHWFHGHLTMFSLVQVLLLMLHFVKIAGRKNLN